MGGMMVAERAELLVFHSTGLLSLVLGRGVVPTFTLAAGENDDVTRH